MDQVPDWIRTRLRDEGFSICLEWSQSSELGQTYVVTNMYNKDSSRGPASCLQYFLSGVQQGKSCNKV